MSLLKSPFILHAVQNHVISTSRKSYMHLKSVVFVCLARWVWHGSYNALISHYIKTAWEWSRTFGLVRWQPCAVCFFLLVCHSDVNPEICAEASISCTRFGEDIKRHLTGKLHPASALIPCSRNPALPLTLRIRSCLAADCHQMRVIGSEVWVETG